MSTLLNLKAIRNSFQMTESSKMDELYDTTLAICNDISTLPVGDNETFIVVLDLLEGIFVKVETDDHYTFVDDLMEILEDKMVFASKRNKFHTRYIDFSAKFKLARFNYKLNSP